MEKAKKKQISVAFNEVDYNRLKKYVALYDDNYASLSQVVRNLVLAAVSKTEKEA